MLRQPAEDLGQVLEGRTDVRAAARRGFQQAHRCATGFTQHVVESSDDAIDSRLGAIAHVAPDMGYHVLAAVGLGALEFRDERFP